MAGQGRGGAVFLAAAALVLCVLLHEAQVAESAVFTVGDRGGWSFNTASWPSGKRFRAGDVLGQCDYLSLGFSSPTNIGGCAYSALMISR